ncbi:MAG: glycosyltransferase [Bacteroidetes bacterium]|nr:glycosyltransferase [Bacteroidota bacterium]
MTTAVLLDNPFVDDRRVLREVTALATGGFRLVVFCVKDGSLPEKEQHDGYQIIRIFEDDIFDIKKTSRLKRYIDPILSVSPDVLHCHDQAMLQMGKMVKKKKPGITLIYDSHELFHSWPLNVSRQNDPVLYLKSWVVRRFQVLREKNNAGYIDHLITVNESLAANLRQYFRLSGKPLILRNITDKKDYPPDPSLLRKRFSIPDTTKILVFIGSAIYPKTLNLEQVIMETADLPDFAFIIISGEQGGKKAVQDWVKDRKYRHVFFHPKIKPEEIGPVLASCDAGIVPTYNKKDLSYWYALDNKLFEYIISEIPVLCTSQPEVARIVEHYKIGAVVNPDIPGEYKRGFLEILNNYDELKNNLKIAKNELNWQNESRLLVGFYNNLERK